jgi:hypothetical protein
MSQKSGIVEGTIIAYNNWTGRYTCIAANLTYFRFLGPFQNWVAALLGISSLFLALWIAVKSFASKALSRRTILLWCFVLFTLYAVNMPNTAEGFYWATSIWNYSLGLTLSLLLCAAVRHAAKCESLTMRLILFLTSCFLCFLAVGCNEFTLLVLLAFLGAVSWLSMKVRHARRWLFLLVFLIAVAAAILSLAAPGNTARSVVHPGSHRLFFSLFCTLVYGSKYIGSWLVSSSLLAASVLFLPVAKVISNRLFPASWKADNRILLAPIAILGLLYLAFFPPYWAMAAHPPERYVNSIYMLFLVGWFFSLALCTPIINKTLRRPINEYYPALNAAGVLLTLALLSQGHAFHAWEDLVLRAIPFAKQIAQREAMIEKAVLNGTQDLSVPPFVKVPFTCYNGDISTDPEDGPNMGFVLAVGLRSIRVDKESPVRREIRW